MVRQLKHLHFNSDGLCETQPAHLVLPQLLRDTITMQEVCFTQAVAVNVFRMQQTLLSMQKSVCAVFFNFRDSAALYKRCTIDPSNDILQQTVNEAEMSKGGR